MKVSSSSQAGCEVSWKKEKVDCTITEKCKIQIFAQILCYCLQSNKRRIIIFNLKQSWLSVTVSVEMSVMVRLILSLLRILLHQIPKRMTAVEDLLDEGAGIL